MGRKTQILISTIAIYLFFGMLALLISLAPGLAFKPVMITCGVLATLVSSVIIVTEKLEGNI